MTLHEALQSATPTTSGDRFAIATPFSDVTFIAALWATYSKVNPELRVRGYQFDATRKIEKEWDVENPEAMTIDFKPMA